MRPRRTMAALAAAAALAGAAGAHEFSAGGLVIEHPAIPATAATAKSAAGYLVIENTGSEADRLMGVKAAFPRVQLHGTETDAAGVSRMVHVEALEIPAGATVTLAPRGLHVMFMGLTEPMREGETVDAVLVFEHAGEVPVRFEVEARGAGMAGH
jgi:copper(I)-binding protein